MEWLFILALAGWTWRQSLRIGVLTRQLSELERQLAALAPARAPETAPPTAPDTATGELLLTQVVPPDADAPLLLDTPIPEASNDDAPLAAETPLAPPAQDEEIAEALAEPLRPIPEAAKPPPRVQLWRRGEGGLEQWLTQNGLAWLGGGALALGGILLVAFATQQTWFTPPVQLGCAIALGAALIGLSEWALRAARPNTLIAALLAGAGVATLYATAWGAHALYGMIGWPGAAGLLALCALLLVGLSFRHGQPLGVLAVLAALFAPALTSAGTWPMAGLTLFLCAVAAAGFTLAALQRWAWAAAVTLVGLYFWFAAAIAADDVPRALALLSVASLGGVALAFRKPLPDDTSARLPWARAHALGPSVAIAISSVATLWTWLSVAPAAGGMVAAPALVGALFVALAAAAVRARVAPYPVLIVAISALSLGFAAYLRARFAFGALGDGFYPFILFAAAATVISALAAKPHRTGRMPVAAAGALGAVLLTLLAVFSRAHWQSPPVWAPLCLSAAMLFAAAWFSARNAPDPRADGAVDFWAGAGAALLLLFIESLFPAQLRAAAQASAALSLVAAFSWQGWRALRIGALVAAGLALMHALSPPLIGATLAGFMPLGQALLILAVAAGFLACAAYIVQRNDAHISTGEALSSAAIFLVLIAVFVALRWLIVREAAPIDSFTEASLRALTLMAAGHLTLPRAERELGRIGAMRGHVLMVAGFIYTALVPGLFANPWWGVAPWTMNGPSILGPLGLAFLGPAALFLFAAKRLYALQRNPARVYAAVGALLAVIWAMLEIRVGFHGAEAPQAEVGVLEGACYALLLLIVALAIAAAAKLRAARGGAFAHDLRVITRGVAWAGLVIAAIILLVARHPWWGAQSGYSSDLETGLAVLAQAGAVVLALALGRALSLSREVEPTRFAAAAAAILLAWSFGHAAIRWLHHQGGMDDIVGFETLEGFDHALWPLVLVLLGAQLTARAPGRDTVRAYLHDLQAIWATAVWPAGAFAALGLWVLYNPWWGLAPAQAGNAAIASLAVTLILVAAALSLLATRTPHLRWPERFAQAAHVAAAGHIFVALNLVVRAGFHGGAITPGPSGGLETWIYSALWALYGVALLAYGVKRNNAVLRWCGLALLLAATLKVFLFDMARLSGFIRVASLLGLAAVLLSTAFFMRRQAPPKQN